MVITNFQIEDKVGRSKFFQEIFLMANTKIEEILEMLFLKLNNTNILFNKTTLIYKSYIIKKTLPTIE